MMREMSLRLTWDPTLADRLRRGLSLSVLGQLGLPEPLSRLLVFGRSDTPPDARMALAAILVPTPRGGTVALSPFGLGKAGATRVPDEVAGRYRSTILRRRGVFRVDDGPPSPVP